MSIVHNVGIADMKIAKDPDTLITYALGSCVGICVFDSKLKIGGLAHIMLPYMPSTSSYNSTKLKFADTCIPFMLTEMEKLGCSRMRMAAKIAGGAKMFEVEGESSIGNIGERNISAVREILKKERIKIFAEDVGLNYGRTVSFEVEGGAMQVRSYAKPLKIL